MRKEDLFGLLMIDDGFFIFFHLFFPPFFLALFLAIVGFMDKSPE